MAQKRAFGGCVLMLSFLLASVGYAYAAKKGGVDRSKSIVVNPFESSVKGAAGLPEATRSSVIQVLKDEGIFAAVLTPDEAKDKDKVQLLEISGRLVDFAGGNAGKRLMVGFGTGRAHAGFEFTIKNTSTGETVWQRAVKQTASFWFNGTTSSATERAELPDGVAKKLAQELKKQE